MTDRNGLRLLVLGASALQLPAVVRARELGFLVGVVDQDAGAPGAAIADTFFACSTNDIEGVRGVAETFKPDGIITIATDRPMRTIARLCEERGLLGPTLAAAHRATDKGLMAEAFAEEAVPAPRTAIVDCTSDLEAISEGFAFPLILKPVDGSGSRGVTEVRSSNGLADAFEYSMGFSGAARIVVQEFLQGPEVSVEGFCLGEELRLVTLTDKVTTGPPHFVELGHSQPSQLSESDQQQVLAVVGKAARALKLSNCAIHAEVIVTSEGPRLVELGGRLGGDFITSHLVPLSLGIDMIKAMIDLACGKEPDLTPRLSAGSAVRFLDAPVCGSFQTVGRANGIPGIIEIGITSSQRVGDLRSSLDRGGHVIATGQTSSEAVERCRQARDVLMGRGAAPGSIPN